MTGLLLHAWSRGKTYPGFGLWGVGAACWALGAVLVLLRPGFVPIPVIVLVGNILMMAHVILYYEGFRRYYQLPKHWRGTPLNLGLFLFQFALQVYFVFIEDNFAVRSMITSGMLSFYFIRLIAEPLFAARAKPDILSIQKLWSISLAPIVFLLLIRCYWLFPFCSDLSQAGEVRLDLNLHLDPVLAYMLLFGIIAQFVHLYTFLLLTNTRIVEDLRSSKENFRISAENAPNFVCMVDLSLNITYCNSFCRILLGYDPEEMLYRPASDFMVESSYAEVQQRHKANVEREASGIKTEILNFEYLLLRKDGSTVWCEERVNVLRDSIGNMRGYISIIWDISQRKKEEELLNIQLEVESSIRKEQERSLDMIAHEYRTPLAVIQSSIDVMRRKGVASGAGLENNLDRVQRATTRLLNVFETAHPRRGDKHRLFQSSASEVEVHELFQELHQAAHHLCGESLCAINHVPLGWVLSCDKSVLDTALLNLLENAVKYAQVDTPVTLNFDICNAHLEVCITNTALGPLPEDMHELFKKFRRGLNTNGVSGTGVGLHLVEIGVLQCGGTIELRADAESKVTAKLKFPISHKHSTQT
ncbi:MAG: PAS domain-containing sensor histidine kinase [Desulfuromonadaceae bacterium]|nr:PAS domain-containing sensor histidine kinase [Desulfuromonas sp.]MDY0185575.1 PAS domain-containing sensor histidine kinase [Desulfuromonadaceae bacterium]